jgi:hypothetical protein
MPLRAPLLAVLVLGLAVAPAFASPAAEKPSFPKGCGDQGVVLAGVTRSVSCAFDCDATRPMFFLAAGQGGTFRMACDGGAAAECTPAAREPCFLDFTGNPLASGLGRCTGEAAGPAAYAVRCGAPLETFLRTPIS